MSFVAKLMEMAAADTDVLRSLDRDGDDFSKSRQVDFLLIAPTAEKAQTLCGFINDFSYGKATANDAQDPCKVLVAISMPVEQPIILCVSGFMACVAELFGSELDGWGCSAQRRS